MSDTNSEDYDIDETQRRRCVECGVLMPLDTEGATCSARCAIKACGYDEGGSDE